MNIFKKYRKSKNYSIQDVCDRLKYSRRVIEAIEKGESDFMARPYNYYCAKNYSTLLGFKIPEDEISKFKTNI